ncbi:AI-2E family transporter [[Eubacterium] hominis]|uniref:AI-2E family transporter n=1 Tax=[Eubacterium] hominis TaxID=2764325 RepID=UPI003A4E3442
MKFKINEDMHRKMIGAIIVVAVGIAIYFAFYKIDFIVGVFRTITGLMMPFILGFAIAFLLNRPMELIEQKVFGKTHMKKQTIRNVSTIITMILAIIIVGFFLALLIPQLAKSAFSLVSAFPGYVDDFQKFAEHYMTEQGINAQHLSDYIQQSDFFNKLTNAVTTALPQMLKMTYQLGSTLLDVLLGIMSAIYMLMDKERLMGYVKKINYAIFPIQASEYLHRMALASADIFNNFIIGKAIDSLIIGILCYIGSLIFQFPYALLLSVFVGVTNMIPVFGPFIGAVPGMFILFIIHPITALYFALFIFVLQQFDGNILGPLILGDKLGLPSIGILFSVVIGGGLFGIIGMFIGVPCFAVIYMAVKEFVAYRLEKKALDLKELSQEEK